MNKQDGDPDYKKSDQNKMTFIQSNLNSNQFSNKSILSLSFNVCRHTPTIAIMA
jgi:hypothetical protein